MYALKRARFHIKSYKNRIKWIVRLITIFAHYNRIKLKKVFHSVNCHVRYKNIKDKKVFSQIRRTLKICGGRVGSKRDVKTKLREEAENDQIYKKTCRQIIN